MDIHIYPPGWFLGEEENRISHGCRHNTDCQAEYKKESAKHCYRCISGRFGSLLQTCYVGVTFTTVHTSGVGQGKHF